MKLDMTKVDLTTKNQKLLAGLMLMGAVGLLYFLLPPFIWFMKNLIYAGVLSAVVGFAVYNRELIWSQFKLASWNMTKKMIGRDKLGYMYLGHDYVLRKIASLEENIKKVGAVKVGLQRKITGLKESLDADQGKALDYERQGAATTIIRTIANKINLTQKQLDIFVPRAIGIEEQQKQLIELHDNWKADAEILKITLDMKADEYNTLKELNEAANTAAEFLSGNTMESKMYQESLNQIEASITEYVSNIENFDRQVKPLLATASADRSVSEDAGLRLIEQYKQKRIALENPNQ